MYAIIVKKSLLEKANAVLLSQPSMVSSICHAEYVGDRFYFWFVSARAVSQASICLFVADILHRVYVK